jgi:hypothetical protein
VIPSTSIRIDLASAPLCAPGQQREPAPLHPPRRHKPYFLYFEMTACCFQQLTSPAKQLLR